MTTETAQANKRVLVTLHYPQSVNRMYVKTKYGMKLSDDAKLFKQEARLCLPDFVRFINPPTYSVGVEIHVYRPRKSGDLDNYLKLTLDSMNGFLWADDAQITQLHVYRHEARSKHQARVELSVWETATESPFETEENARPTPSSYPTSQAASESENSHD